MRLGSFTISMEIMVNIDSIQSHAKRVILIYKDGC